MIGQIIWEVVIALLACVGIAALMWSIYRGLLVLHRVPPREKVLVTLRIDGTWIGLDKIVSNLIWMGRQSGSEMTATLLDDGMDEQTLRMANYLCDMYPDVRLERLEDTLADENNLPPAGD